MALTNFALLTDEQLTIWKRDLWKQARNMSFINKFLGKGPNSTIQHITELKKSEKGARAVITLLADLEGDGVAGDRTLEGNEEILKSYDQVIRIDQLRHANRHEGRMADQKSVVEFRGNSKDLLAYWLADRIDQMAFLTMAGIAYTQKNSGGARTGSDLRNLEFAEDVKAPTAKRVARWNGALKQLEIGGATSDVTTADLPMWEMLVQAKAYAKENYIRPNAEKGGEESYNVFLSPMAMSKLKLDPTYMQNLRHAQSRDGSNPLFSGSTVKIDGLYLHEFRHVPNTRLAPVGQKFGAGAVEGCHIIFAGAQAMGMADIGNPEWVEKGFDYENQQGISVAKMLGFLKPQFKTQYSGGTVEDHGLMLIRTAQ